ncbi:Hpt domain-containing protein [Demequina capsici]|uniref:Hpt domain-containing protein n=1 Tax=Demequina capsici TaxID=3075620 RepID=A0AA96F8N4_9MICO|nr:Hpt domain-containing protein [Demequina sp. OYTSA14]WNM24685.1 Hpt domain-containing protein [Demequina sp. OYTSA14]
MTYDPSAIIAELWERFRPTIAARLEAIDAGLVAIRQGAGAGDARVTDAHRAAHNLAGALGSYERPEGSVVARRLMAALEQARPDAEAVAALLAELREHCR